MSKKEVKQRTNWKQLASDLGFQLDHVTKELEELKETKELNENELIQIASQRDQLEQNKNSLRDYVNDLTQKTRIASYLIDIQKELNTEVATVLSSLANIQRIAGTVIQVVANLEEVTKGGNENEN